MVVRRWTKEETAELERLYAAKVQLDAIAGQLGVTIPAAAHKLQRMKIVRPRHNLWTAAEDELVTRLWAEKVSCRLIAEQVKRPTNAVIGRVHRLNLPARKRGTTPNHSSRPMVAKAAEVGRPRKRKRTYDLDKRRMQVPLGDQKRSLPTETSDSAVSLFDIGCGQCRWPLNDTVPISDFLFCGAPTKPDKPYCGRHYGAAYG